MLLINNLFKKSTPNKVFTKISKVLQIQNSIHVKKHYKNIPNTIIGILLKSDYTYYIHLINFTPSSGNSRAEPYL